jgi:benzoyl-CoA reductase/2-hydroxyglutaryl-CoA dehydratase subunit BcrC/BadD/HgdB
MKGDTMTTDYTPMWQELGLDLAGHDALLNVLGSAYSDIYLSQKNRPKGMGYFDFVMSEVHGLRIRELMDEKAAGRKIIGSYCVFVPEEIVLAANATLVGLCSGADFAMEEVEQLLPRNTCALIKSSFGFKIGKVCPYLESADMIMGEESCVGERGTRNLTDNTGTTVDEMMDAIVDRYFKVDCAIFTPNPDRLDHIQEMVAKYNAQGVIHYGLQFCQPYLMESFSSHDISHCFIYTEKSSCCAAFTMERK